MPAEAPEISDRGGHPWAVGKLWPSPCWFSEEDEGYECYDMVKHVDHRVDHHGTAYGAKSCPGITWDQAQGRVEDGASFGKAGGGSDMMDEALGDVER